jgi:5'-methylthioadenosine phosphorylase
MPKLLTEVPRTPFAILSGSAGWGVPFPEGLNVTGVRIMDRNLAFETPWGQTANWQVLEIDGSQTLDGKARLVLNVFSHGWSVDAIDHSDHRRVGWVLQQAGAKKVLADSTCGSLNKFLAPRDFIIPADVIDFSQTAYSLAKGRFRHVMIGRQLFCPDMARIVETTARALWPPPGRVLGHSHDIVAAHNWGPRYSSAAEARAYQHLGADAINQSIGAEATVVREVGACFVSASYIVRHQDSIAPHFSQDDLDQIHHDLAEVSSRISLFSIARVSLSDACGCAALRIERPEEYALNAQGRKPTTT